MTAPYGVTISGQYFMTHGRKIDFLTSAQIHSRKFKENWADQWSTQVVI